MFVNPDSVKTKAYYLLTMRRGFTGDHNQAVKQCNTVRQHTPNALD